MYLINEAAVLCKRSDGTGVGFKGFSTCGEQVIHKLVVCVHKPEMKELGWGV